MSYIIKSANPFASTKLTEKGREKLAKGQLTFSSWAIGDSEINYDREVFVDDATLSGTSKILRPKDKQPDLKYFINTGAASPLVAFGANDVRCVKAIINNEADERGHFSGSLSSGFTTHYEASGGTMSSYIRNSGYFSAATEYVDGSMVLSGTTGGEIGDFVLLKVGYSGFTNEDPYPHLWFKVQDSVSPLSGFTTLTLDRNMPNITGGTASFIIYKGGEIYDNEPDSISYWDTGTLSFDSSLDITVVDVPTWNMNIPFSEDILGITGTTEYEKANKFGSYDYLGEKDNYLFDPTVDFNKSIGIIHYTNKTISNLYGEFFFIDNDDSKTVKIHLPDLMYHRRYFSGGTSNGDKMGMTFLASGATVSVETNGLKYVPLIEDATLIGTRTAKAVGRVYPDLKIIVITDPEILAAVSYKSNRNWTLPKLNLNVVNPDVVGVGTLAPDETMYVTYLIDNNSGSGINTSLPCQDYAILKNTETLTKDVQFYMEETDSFPFMRGDNTSDGFYGDTFKILYQVTSGDTRPITGSWKEINFSDAVSTAGGFINPSTLEGQNPLAFTPRFQISQTDTLTASTYSVIDKLNMAPILSADTLQFGDEKLFYGNVETYIGATIYKTLFKITINSSDFSKTTNITRSADPTTNPPVIKVSEVGIYDSSGDLVIIAKLSKPIKLTPGNTVMIELSIDF
jgi:hypothetical protein